MNTQEQLDNDLIQAAQYGNLINVKSLIEQGADIHAKDDYAFRNSAASEYLDIVKYLLEQGSDIHADNDCALK
jgi:ankyrin repeat protein